ncbi:hypothetical protein [Hyalangium sp.]|uniref:hypothetical protein n=1 Tax=Hyalangium sp. TaxID=2028555 RepID=UPI002D22F9A6|nr:hypothetical protein [Hyalangium sp.]HYI01363.1 hypothetical protein [Hyalangium sp.]
MARPLFAGMLGALLFTVALNAPGAYAQAMATGISVDVVAALLGQDLTAARYVASATSGTGLKCNSALMSCIDLGPGTLNTIGTNVAGDILLSDGSGTATVRIGETIIYGNGSAAFATNPVQVNGNGTLTNATSNTPLTVDDTDGFRVASKASLPTCGDGTSSTVRPGTIAFVTAGSSVRTKMCVCTSDGEASPGYDWVGVDFGTGSSTVGDATTCPAS